MIDANSWTGDTRLTENLGDARWIAHQPEGLATNTPELVAERDSIHDFRVILESAGVKPGSRRQRFCKRDELTCGLRIVDSIDRRERRQIAVTKIIGAPRFEAALHGGKRGCAGTNPQDQ